MADSATTLADLRRRLQVGTPVFWLTTWEEERWGRLLASVATDLGWTTYPWSQVAGIDFGKSPEPQDTSIGGVLAQLRELPPQTMILLRDGHLALSDPQQARALRDALAALRANRQALCVITPSHEPPFELSRDVVRMLLPLPDYEELRHLLAETLLRLGTQVPTLSNRDEDRLIKACLGLTGAEATHGWARALVGRSQFQESVINDLVTEKKRLAAGSTLVEFCDLDEGANDVGGLDVLKDWLLDRAEAYSPQAREQGVPLPRGVLLLGVQGCGKSLTARASAQMLSFPLVRVDMTSIISAERGQSERNLRDVIRLADNLAPVVLWLDEIEKGFAGGEGDDAMLARLMGAFLTWMSEQKKPVFVVATANSVNNLPSEMIRRGRFDEMFFVDLPNFAERQQILQVHLRKRGWKSEAFDLPALANETDGYSGAELEQIVSASIVTAFAQKRAVTMADLHAARAETVPLSVTMEDKVFALREWAKDRCRRATSDSRVNQMLDAERREGRLGVRRPEIDVEQAGRWRQLAAAGQIKSAVVELVKREGRLLIPALQKELEGILPTHGDRGVVLKDSSSTVLWHDLSDELSSLLLELVHGRRLYLIQAAVADYEKLGSVPPFPPKTAPASEATARPGWFPVALRTSPDKDFSKELSRLARVQIARGR